MTYVQNKELAEVGNKIEKGEKVNALRSLDINHSIWLASLGAGFGKLQWR